MKRTFFLIASLFCVTNFFAQAPTLYIHLVSHNEPTDNMQTPLNYAKAKTNALQMANLVVSKNVKWNLQTSDGFVVGAKNDELATGTNYFETITTPTYSNNIEVDTRSKNSGGRNIADQWYLLDSIGANPTQTLGGFIWAVCPPALATSIDWFPYRNPVIGNIHGNSWQCNLLSGAGSLSPHCNDLNDFGIFKPLSTTNFYSHDPSPTNNLWCMGVGCAPVLDSLDDEQAIIDLIQGQVDSIQNGLWPANKFYVTRIMTNQREYGPMFFQKMTKVLDSLNLIAVNTPLKLKWATISETFNDFTSWQGTSGLEYSQWLCGETYNGIPEQSAEENLNIYPNPFNNLLTIESTDARNQLIEITDCLGRIVNKTEIKSKLIIDLSSYENGIYFVKVGNVLKKVIKNN